MNENVNKIINLEFNAVIASGEYTMLLLSLYSKLYLNGSAPRTCKAQMFKYYNELKKTGIMTAELHQEIKDRTLETSFVGHKHLRSGLIVSSLTITDALAISYLEKGILKESDFKKLPKGYKQKAKDETTKAEKKTKKVEKKA